MRGSDVPIATSLATLEKNAGDCMGSLRTEIESAGRKETESGGKNEVSQKGVDKHI